jgi:hypothetical protein
MSWQANEADKPTRLLRLRLPTPMRLMMLIWLTRPLMPLKSNEANASNSAWVDMVDANESNDGKFDFCGTTTSLSSVPFPLLVFSRSPSQNIAKPLLK